VTVLATTRNSANSDGGWFFSALSGISSPSARQQTIGVLAALPNKRELGVPQRPTLRSNTHPLLPPPLFALETL
jgi:hypothetical protein